VDDETACPNARLPYVVILIGAFGSAGVDCEQRGVC